jgi:dimethylaniline monooxygenase (N-oxide forming)
MDTFDTEVCVIGAGPAGLAAGKALLDRGIDLRCFEKGSMVGGLWRIDNDNGGSPAYRSLHLNSSRQRTQFPSYPMPEDWPDFPSHELVARYFQSFAEHHGLLEHITFDAEVVAVDPLPGPGEPGASGWRVRIHGGTEVTCRAVVVANGHHSSPRVPSFPGRFDGVSFHAKDYLEPSVFTDRDVLVVGVGNSGMDIACDAATVARRVLLATRHGVHVIPKYAFGRPLDHFTNAASAYVPFPVERALVEVALRLAVGRPEDRGLPKPDHRLFGAHPTVSAELLDRVGHGDIEMKPNLAELDGDKVWFVDGSVEPVDVLVYATGYDVTLPFLDPAVLDAPGNVLDLYLRVVPPRRRGLFLVGFVQTVGANIALMEHQAEWIGDLLTGACELPSAEEMATWIAEDRRAMTKRYIRSERHTMQVDYWRYIRAVRQARRRGAQPAGVASGGRADGPTGRVAARLTAATEPLRRRVTAVRRGSGPG